MSHARQHPLAPNGLQRAFVNDIYSVQFYNHDTRWGKVTLLMIRRHDAEPIQGWDDLQRIKDELVGPERVAIEVYPEQSNLINVANMRHLWVMEEGFEIPFGLHNPERTLILKQVPLEAQREITA